MNGIACAGNWVLDRSKFINYFPNIEGHATIDRSIPSTGGAPLNVLMALARLQAPFPCYGIGLIAKTNRGRELTKLCESYQVNTEFVRHIDGQSSFSDAFVLPDGSRTLFHCPGVNDLLSPDDVPIELLKKRQVKIFYLGHLMILKAMDAIDDQYGTKSARLLHLIQQAGIETTIDTVSDPSHPYDKLVAPALKYTDHLICNEFEAEQLSHIKISKTDAGLLSKANCHEAAKALFAKGVCKTVVIHASSSAYALLANGESYYQQSLNIPADKIIASCGAGDAFCAGVLFGIHEQWDMQKALLLGVCTSAASLTTETNGEGILPLSETLALADQWR